MTIVEHLQTKHTVRDSKRGWMAVSEKEWNAYYRECGGWHFASWEAGRSLNTLSFRGCQLRVL